MTAIFAVLLVWLLLMVVVYWHYHNLGVRQAIALLRPELEEIREVLRAATDSGETHWRTKVLFALVLLEDMIGKKQEIKWETK